MLRALLLCLTLAALLGLSRAAAANRDPAQWESEIRAFEAQDRAHPPAQGAVLFVGSSTIRYWTNLAECFPRLATIRRGFGGSHLTDSVAFADRIVIPYHPSKIVLYAGENDIARGDSPEEVAAAFRNFARKVRADLPKTPIYFVSIKPAPVRWHLSPQEIRANALIRRSCWMHRGLKFVDVWPDLLDNRGQPNPKLYKPDNLHLTAEGYQILARAIDRALAE